MTKLDKFYRSFPKHYKVETNEVLNALVRAFAGEDAELETQLKNTKAQLFVKTASGVYLDQLASNFGVTRPVSLGMSDADFRELIPNQSFKVKQVSKSFYDTMDIFWGPTYSRANVVSSSVAPFAVSIGDSFTVTVDGGAAQTYTITTEEIANNGFATASEMVRILNRVKGVTAEKQTEINGDEKVSLRTNTVGLRGSLLIASGSLAGMGFSSGVKHKLTDLTQRTLLYQTTAGEVILELPAIVPKVRKTLKGSHHFHDDYEIEAPQPPSNTVWQGSFLFKNSGNNRTVTAIKTTLSERIKKGVTLNQITLADTTGFDPNGGLLIFNFGRGNEEEAVPYLGVPNDRTIVLDPGYAFESTHETGSEVNLMLIPNTAFKPRTTGEDYAVYFTSPSNARIAVQTILKDLAAAGVVVTFEILLPDYRYIISNPYNEA